MTELAPKINFKHITANMVPSFEKKRSSIPKKLSQKVANLNQKKVKGYNHRNLLASQTPLPHPYGQN